MKKLMLLSLAGAVSFGAFAQVKRQALPSSIEETTRNVPLYINQTTQKELAHVAAKPAATAFYTETFDGGLPAGWTVSGSAAGGGWKWMNAASASPYSLGTIASTSASNGWMLYDSDSIGTAFPSVTPLEGYLTSGTINCAGHASVRLQFQEKYRKFNDSTFVDVSNNNGTTWVRYDIKVNKNLATNVSTGNPEVVSVNISAVAAGSSTVKIRFYYKGMTAGGSYSWLIDDVELSELPAVDIELPRSGVLTATGSFAAIPLHFLTEPLDLYAILNNNGGTDQNSLNANVKIYDGSTMVFDKSVPAGPLPIAAEDSLAIWTDTDAFPVTDTGFYTAAFSIAATGDEASSDNMDTTYFNITNDLFSMNSGSLVGGYYIHRPSSVSPGEASNVMGTRFQMPGGIMDTLTGIRASFASTTSAGVVVNAQVYKFDESALSWTIVTDMKPVTLTAADISTSSSIKYVTFVPDFVANGVESYILDGGSTGAVYAAVIQSNGATPSQTVVINASEVPSIDFEPSVGIYDSSMNNGGVNFAIDGLPFGLPSVPLVQMVFGNASTVGISNINNTMVLGNAYPNPANTEVSIPVQLQVTGNVTVNITNAVGQTVAIQNLGKVAAGQKATATFNTQALANGVYFYTVEANGQRLTQRFAVSR